MPIPKYQTLMLPVLQSVADGQEHYLKDIVEKIAIQFDLSVDERTEKLSTDKQSIFDNRVGWARTYLKKAGLVESPKRGVVKITKKGLDVLKQKPSYIDSKLLEQFPEFLEFKLSRPEYKMKRENEIRQINSKK